MCKKNGKQIKLHGNQMRSSFDVILYNKSIFFLMDLICVYVSFRSSFQPNTESNSTDKRIIFGKIWFFNVGLSIEYIIMD